MHTLLSLLTALAPPSWADDGLDPDAWSAEPGNKKAGTKEKAKSKPNAARDKNTYDKSTTKAKAKANPSKPAAVGGDHRGPAGPHTAGKPGPAPGTGPRYDANRPKQAPAATRASSPRTVKATARVAPPHRRHPDVKVQVNVRAGGWNHSHDHRWARPNAFVVHVHPHHHRPAYVWYRPRWTHWWVHPYWRWTHATGVIVVYDYTPDPWTPKWVPPQPRAGYVWVDGYWAAENAWVPGYWKPVQPDPTWMNTSWVWVPGWWMGESWVEGYWRLRDRPGWIWVEGYYIDDGSYVRGWWEPESPPPQNGYVWEAGFWDSEYWVEGYWRPEERDGYAWVDGYLDTSGIYHTGYWEPVRDEPGMVWIPGWFDGNEWVEGEWVSQAEYDKADPENWQPDAGWDVQAAGDEAVLPESDEPPPALPFSGPPA